MINCYLLTVNYSELLFVLFGIRPLAFGTKAMNLQRLSFGKESLGQLRLELLQHL